MVQYHFTGFNGLLKNIDCSKISNFSAAPSESFSDPQANNELPALAC